ncbi:MAG: hypothetical protein P4N59_03615 [Negativicutes bacterium]|nr:hypothetical protein [Negativicutes bacterium]
MTLEESIKDVVAQKMADGTVEKLIGEQLEKGIANALESLIGRYGDVAKVIEKQIKSVMVPYLEQYDYSEYIVKLDAVLVQVLQSSAIQNKTLLENFKHLMLPEDRKTVTVSELYDIWCKFVAEEVKTDGLEVEYDSDVSYESVEVTLDVDHDESRSWSCYRNAKLIFECEHDEEMNFAIPIYQWEEEKKKDEWSISYHSAKDISSLRHLNKFEILLMSINQAGTKLVLDTDHERDDIQPEKEPEARY